MPWDNASKGYNQNTAIKVFWELQQSLYSFLLFSEWNIILWLSCVFHWWFHLCYKYWDTWNGFVCLETSTSEGFWKLLQSFSFTYATINEDIYATLCVDIIRRRNHVHMLYVQCCYTWYFKNLFLLGLGFLHGSKNLKKDDWRYYKIRIGNQS